MKWLIDGFNVILSDSKLGMLFRNDGEAGRAELVFEIANSGGYSSDDVTVVFDGRFGSSVSREGRKLTVRFTARGETADDFIKGEIGKSNRRRSLFVVSNDHSIVDYARECGANAVSSADFLARLRNRTPGRRFAEDPKSEKPESTGRPDPELLKLFTGKKR